VDRRIRVFRFEENVGVAFGRNFALEKADCEYVAFLDADDLAHPSHLAVQVAYLDSRPQMAPPLSHAMD
jgi:teichuronic acid biosynthesis glycosyltransferase TuaG